MARHGAVQRQGGGFLSRRHLLAATPLLLWALVLAAHHGLFHQPDTTPVAAENVGAHDAIAEGHAHPTDLQEWEELGEDTSVEDADTHEAVVEVIAEAEPKVLEEREEAAIPDPNPSSTQQHCPPNRRPFRVLLTSESGVYQEWQTRVLHYHYTKQAAANPCTEMGGFSRVLSSVNAKPDKLMDSIPTFVAASTDYQTHRGFHVINRPWSMVQLVNSPRFREIIPEDYVYIMETDHLLLQDLPNLAPDKDTVAGFYFPYMDPNPSDMAKVVSRFYKEGPPSDLYATGPSPTILHVDVLKRIVQLWYDMSVKLKHDAQADRAFGWALEMWGWSIAAAKLNIKHKIIQKFQIEPSATWHQNVTVEDPYIFHYTFGHEYTKDGIPLIGVGEWSLDKRRWTTVWPPPHLTAPPKCAGEATHVLTGLLNEAMGSQRASWGNPRGRDTALVKVEDSAADSMSLGTGTEALLMAVMTQLGGWTIGAVSPVYFYRNFHALTPTGSASWAIRKMGHPTSPFMVVVDLCNKEVVLQFEGDPTVCITQPTDIAACVAATKLSAKEPHNGKGEVAGIAGGLAKPPPPPWPAGEEKHPVVQRMAGAGPWSWQGVTPISFLRGGQLVVPWGEGKWGAVGDGIDKLFMNFAGAEHEVVLGECHQWMTTRKSDQNQVPGWMQIPLKANCAV